ncbi:MAG: glycosyltransferase family 9 protein [Gammaproteobacteria bacterium]|nr:glycosyltransferase family 9 protein [Gammaproteobacteria bacterium]MCK5262547.1 glycosyltransferase family 9 protein [Gammaproteobacteria bacterium]
MPAAPKNILIIRNDKLGDFMLAWPTFQMVKQAFPESAIYTLVPEYTKPMAELCPWIDEIIVDDQCEGIPGLIKTTSKLRAANIDAVLNLHSTPRVALALFFAGIRHRFAPASRIDQVMYNHTLKQRRSRSEKPEHEYNTDLAAFMDNYYGIDYSYSLKPPLLKFPEKEILKIRENFYANNNIEPNKKLVFVHAGSGGSATNLSIEQYAELVTLLSENNPLFFVLTAGPGEENIAKRLSELIKHCDHIIHSSDKGIAEFAKLLSIANLFISGSTGTLHVAGALDTPTAAFYPKRKSATSLRWQTLNSNNNRLSLPLASASTPTNSDTAKYHRQIINKYLNNNHG